LSVSEEILTDTLFSFLYKKMLVNSFII